MSMMLEQGAHAFSEMTIGYNVIIQTLFANIILMYFVPILVIF